MKRRINLKDYIDEYYGGTNTKFAKAFDKHYQNVQKYITAGYCVIVDEDKHSLVYEAKEGTVCDFEKTIYHITGEKK